MRFFAQTTIGWKVDAETGRFTRFALDLQKGAMFGRSLVDYGEAETGTRDVGAVLR